MIKVVNLVSVIVAPIIVKYSTGLNWGVVIVAIVLLGVVGWAIMQSKKDVTLTGAPLPAMAPIASKPAASAPAKDNKQTPPHAANNNKQNPPKKK